MGLKLSFSSKIVRIAEGMEYYALSVPAKITAAVGTKAAVPVSAQVNGSEKFIASLYPVGGGRHFLRVRNKICKSVNVKAGSPVKVKVEVRDRYAEIKIPKDVKAALQKAGALKGFHSFPVGKKSFALRRIQQAVQPETRAKRMAEVVKEAKNCKLLKRGEK